MTPRDDALPFEHMSEAANRAMRYAVGSSPDSLRSDPMRADAILRVMGVLGEAASRVRPEVRARFPALPWKQMMGMRNAIVHAYDRVDWSIVWETVTVHLPAMMPALVEAKTQMNAEQPPTPEVSS